MRDELGEKLSGQTLGMYVVVMSFSLDKSMVASVRSRVWHPVWSALRRPWRDFLLPNLKRSLRDTFDYSGD